MLRKMMFVCMVVALTLAFGTVAFASGTDLTDMSWLTADLVSPIISAVTTGLTVLIPVGIGIMAVMVGVSLIPRIIYKFF